MEGIIDTAKDTATQFQIQMRQFNSITTIHFCKPKAKCLDICNHITG